MKVGVVLPSATPTAGGAFTFEESVSKALTAIRPGDVELVFYSIDGGSPEPGSKTKTNWTDLWNKAWAWLYKRLGLVSCREFDAFRRSVNEDLLKGSWVVDNPLNRAMVSDGCQLAYFVTPAMVPVEVPFIATHWDLGHRRWPMFPEVSLTGVDWGRREWYFTHWLQRASLIMTGTATGKAELMTAYGIQDANIAVNAFPVPEWIASTAPEVPKQLLDRGPFVFYPAQFWPHKNHIVLLEALRLLKSEGVEVTLVLTGSDKGNFGFIKQMVSEYSIENQVVFPGFVSRGELLWLYQNAALMAFPCFIGPDNLPPLEALAAGCHVAVADIPGARDYLSADSVLFFDPLDERALADLLRNALRETRSNVPPKPPKLPTARDYAHNVLNSLEGLAKLRRCWGTGYEHS